MLLVPVKTLMIPELVSLLDVDTLMCPDCPNELLPDWIIIAFSLSSIRSVTVDPDIIETNPPSVAPIPDEMKTEPAIPVWELPAIMATLPPSSAEVPIFRAIPPEAALLLDPVV